MLHIDHYCSIDGLSSCFVLRGQLLGDNGCWTGRVLYHRHESPCGAEYVCRVKDFPAHPTQEALLADIEAWIKQSLFERWTANPLQELDSAATAEAPVGA